MNTDLDREDVGENPSSLSSRMELKRIHQWLTQEDSGSELFCTNKRQVVEIDSGFLTPLMSAWDDDSLVPRQLTNVQHASDLLGRYISPLHQEVLHGSSINQVCESQNIPESMAQFYGEGVSRSFETGPSYDTTFSFGQTCSDIDKSFMPNLSYDQGDENVFSTFHPFEKGAENFALMGQSLQKADENVMSLLPCDKASENLFMIESSSYHKESVNVMLSGGQSPYTVGNDMAFMVPSQEQADQNSDQTSHENFSHSPAIAKDHLHVEAEENMSSQFRYPHYASSRVDTPLVPKSKDSKTAKKGTTSTFPSNVKSLLSTGMFDGVTVKYYSWSREKNLKGVIKGTGYLCGCSDCNLNKVLNAYEFEQHANCKTKHPNNHIYFENGKTIYGVVQELKNTPQEKLFDAIQNVTGSDINHKNFNTWKASYQVASLELQRIYGKEAVTLAS